jgi:nickel/cobalt exporter
MSIYTIVICTRGDKAQRLSGGSEGGGALFMRGVEFGAAGLVLLFGVGLLFGYLAAERVTCF